MGSASDKPTMEPAGKELHERGIRFEVRVLSAHRDPEAVADYARNAHMRGLRVIIAAAGMSAALPGRGRGPHRPAGDRRPDQGQEHRRATGSTRCCRWCRCRPACRSRAWRSTAPGTRPCWRRAISGCCDLAVDPALHPPGDGARVVGGAQARGLAPGRGRGLRGARRAGRGAGRRPRSDQAGAPARLRRPSASASRSPTTTWPRSSTSSRQSVGEAGRWIHFGLTSSDVLDTALALQLREAGRELVAGADALTAVLVRARARVRRRAVHGAHPRRARRADDLRREARRLRVREPPRRRPAARARSATPRWASSRARSGPTRRSGRRSSAAALERLGLRAEDVSTQVVPRDRHAEVLTRDRARRRVAGAARDGDPPPAAHRGARGRGAVRAKARRARARCRTSATRSPASASPASPGCCAATRRRASRTSRCGTSATSRIPRSNASRCRTRPRCSTTCST